VGAFDAARRLRGELAFVDRRVSPAALAERVADAYRELGDGARARQYAEGAVAILEARPDATAGELAEAHQLLAAVLAGAR